MDDGYVMVLMAFFAVVLIGGTIALGMHYDNIYTTACIEAGKQLISGSCVEGNTP